MNKKIYILFSVFILIVSALISADRAVAMSNVAIHGDSLSKRGTVASVLRTPYPTLTQIGSTPTKINPISTINTDCPPGVPSGYGTVTPSVDWLYLCSHCLPTTTPQDFFTSTPGATHTPFFTPPVPPVCQTSPVGGEVCYTQTPQITSTPTVTVTPTVTGTPLVSGSGFTCLGLYQDTCFVGEVTNYLDEFSMSFSNNASADLMTINITSTPKDVPITVYYSYDVTATWAGAHPSYTPYIAFRTWAFYPSTSWGGWVAGMPPVHSGGQVGVSGSYRVQQQGTFTVTHTNNNTNGGINLSFSFKNNNVGWPAGTNPLLTGNIFVSLVGYPSTPTPIPVTPTYSPDYCSSISSASMPNQFEFGGSGNVVRQQCAVTPEISLKDIILWFVGPIGYFLDVAGMIDEIFPDPLIIESWTICIRERDYSLYLFGVRMPLEFILALAIVLGGLRFFSPSAFSGATVIGNKMSHDAHENEKQARSERNKK